jgi:hypothetical protein
MFFKGIFTKEGIKDFVSVVYKILLPVVCVLLIGLSIQIYELPFRMATMNGKPKNDTITIIKTETATLQVKNKFVFVTGQLDKKSYKFIDKFDYNTDYPKEIYEGYITKITTTFGGKYYVWTKNDLSNGDLSISMTGWFFTDDGNKFQELDPSVKTPKPEYLQLIYPVVESKFE